MKKLALLFALNLFCFTTIAQEIKFGKVSLDELNESTYPLDSTAPAAILFKSVRVYYDYNSSDGFKLTTQIHERIKIYNKAGLEWAENSVSTYQADNIKETASIKGFTYNLVSGKIVEEKLKSNQIFKEVVDENWTKNKFTMPNVQVGSVVEWYYTITSPFSSNIDDVIFQYLIPVKKMTATIAIPQYYTFKYMPTFYYPIKMNQSSRDRTIQFTTRTEDGTGAKTSLNNETVILHEVIYSADVQSIPAIKEEPFINSLTNYIAKVHFEHTSTQFPNKPINYYSTDWESVTKSIYKNYYFGKQLEGTNFLKEDVATQTANAKTDDEKATILYNFIKNKIKWNGNYGKYTEKGIKKAYQDHVGNVADINLCLVAMFKEAGLKSYPVLISTRNHGIPLFPTVDGFNYVVVAIEFPQGISLFDATEFYGVPNILPSRALNWKGRLVRDDETSTEIDLFGLEPAKERINLFVKIDEKGSISGLKRSSFYSNNALSYRKGKAFMPEKDLITALEKENHDVLISDLKITNKEDLSNPVVETFKFESDNLCDVIDGKIYFSPLLILAGTKNPFTLENRMYPIDFGTTWEDNYFVTIQIPEGYAISTLPENFSIALPNNMGVFKYMITKKGENKIEALTSTQINFPIIAPQYYADIKLFYKQLIDKQNEKVVLTKL